MGQFGPIGKGATWTSLGKLAHAPQTLGFGGGGCPRWPSPGEGYPGEVLPTPSPYIKAAHPPFLLIQSNSFSPPPPLLSSPRALAPCLGWHRLTRGSSTLRTPSRCWISGPSLSSSAALLDRSPEDVYTPYVCRTAEVLHVWHFVIVEPASLHDLEVGVVASSSTPFIREREKAFGLQGYDFRSLSVTYIYIDRSWAGVLGQNYCFLCRNPNSGIRAMSMRRCFVWLERIA